MNFHYGDLVTHAIVVNHYSYDSLKVKGFKNNPSVGDLSLCSYPCSDFGCYHIHCRKYKTRNISRTFARLYRVSGLCCDVDERVFIGCSECRLSVKLPSNPTSSDIEYIGFKHRREVVEIENLSYTYKFRCGPVPKTGRFNNKKTAHHWGASNKGLIFSSYKKSFDQQLDYDESCFYDEIGEEGTTNFQNRRMKNMYRNSGMVYYDGPYRHGAGRTWKRTKVRKQWERKAKIRCEREVKAFNKAMKEI